MSVDKVSVSLDVGLAQHIKASAAARGESFSAWLAGAAHDRLRLEALGEAVAAWEDEYGALTGDEVAAAQRTLARATKRRPSAA